MEKPLSADEIEAYERELRALFTKIVGQVESVSRSTLEPSGDPEQQPSDENVEEVGFERSYEPLAVEDALAYQVRTALRRIEEGTYGTCERCGAPIGRERLDEVPYAVECVGCARLSETEATA